MKLIDLLLGFQRKAASTVARFLILLWSRQTGKGYTTSFVASRGAEIEPRSNWLIVAPTERQSLETLDKCKNWIKAAHLSVAETEEEFDALEKGAKIKAKVIVLSNGSKIYALPGKPASLRGFTGYLVIDEFAFFEDQKEVWKAVFAVIVNPMASIKRVIITSTPNGKGDMFHKLVDENFLNPKEGRRIKWEVQKVTIHEAAKAWEEAGKLGTVIDEKTGEERPKTAEEYVEETREAFDCPEAWPQEFECEFLDASANLLSFDMITAAESAEATEHGFDPDEPGEFYGGFDFGGIKDPSIFWFAKKVGDRMITRDVLVLRGLDTEDQIEAVKTRIDKCTRVCVDYSGPGRGFGDMAAKRWGEYDPDPKKFLNGKIELFRNDGGNLWGWMRQYVRGYVTRANPNAHGEFSLEGTAEQDEHGEQMPIPTDDLGVIRNEVWLMTYRCFKDLWNDDPRKAYVLFLKTRMHLSSAEVAEMLDLTEANVDQIFSRSVKQMRENWRKHEKP